MKIYFDKSDANVKPSLTAACLRDILALVPAEWLVSISEVRVSNSLVPDNSRCRPGDASFNPYDHRLTIFARDCSPEHLVTSILSALAAHHQDFPYRRGSRLSEIDARKLARIVAPQAEYIIRCLATHSNARLSASSSK